MILTQLPDLPPRPETPRNAAFRRAFYKRWGTENSVVAGYAKRAEYTVYRQTLSIKTVTSGREHYFIDGRRLTVTDETYLVLNEQREYGSLLEAPQDAHTFCLFFRPKLVADVIGDIAKSFGAALESEGEPAPLNLEFSEHLRRHDRTVTPVLKFIRRHMLLGVDDQNWYDEQFLFLASRLAANEANVRRSAERIQCVGAAKRRELLRRLGWATDFVHSNLHREITLDDIARAARLSQYHFLRLFRQAHGVTPMAYVREQRTQRALALLHTTSLTLNEVSAQVGLTRLALWRYVNRALGEAPQRLRRSLQECSASAAS